MGNKILDKAEQLAPSGADTLKRIEVLEKEVDLLKFVNSSRFKRGYLKVQLDGEMEYLVDGEWREF